MSSSPDAVVRAGSPGAVSTPSLATDLRSGGWTRLGGNAILGDGVTESALRSLAETTRSAARAQGYAVGWSEGRRANEERARETARAAAELQAEREIFRAAEHEQAVTALRTATALLEESIARTCASVEAHSVEIALQLAESILGRELSVAANPGADAIRRALAMVPDGASVLLRLHPADLAKVDVAEFTGTAVQLLEDPAIQPGDAVAETTDSVIDAGVRTALTRVREVLTSCTP